MKTKIIFLLLLIVNVSCEEGFLDRSSPTEISSNALYQSEEDIQLVLNGVYKALQSNSIYGGSFNTGGVCSIVEYDSFTDNTWNWFVGVGPGNYTKGEIDPSHGFFKNTWAAHYSGIVRCNEAIFNIAQMSEELVSDEAKSGYLGQLYFLRGLFYFNLAVYYEDVPLILEPQTLDNPYPVKSSQAEVLEQVKADLTLAVESLPIAQPSDLFGYATKGAALGLLARVQLFEGNWSEVARLTEEVINLGIYNLDFPYDQQFTPEGEQSGDVVFSVRFEDMPGFGVGELFSRTQENKADPTHQPLKNLADAYYCSDGLAVNSSPLYDPASPKANRDPRLLASLYFNGDTFNLDLPHVKVNIESGFAIKKYVRNKISEAGTRLSGEGGQDYYVIRYADILFMRAEALIESNQLSEEVYSLINQVRARVNMPEIEDVEGSGLEQGQLRDILRHERRVEFALEGLRFFDIKRWGTVEEAYARATQDANDIAIMPPYEYRGERSEVFAIHESELDANPNLEQHEAWK